MYQWITGICSEWGHKTTEWNWNCAVPPSGTRLHTHTHTQVSSQWHHACSAPPSHGQKLGKRSFLSSLTTQYPTEQNLHGWTQYRRAYFTTEQSVTQRQNTSEPEQSVQDDCFSGVGMTDTPMDKLTSTLYPELNLNWSRIRIQIWISIANSIQIHTQVLKGVYS